MSETNKPLDTIRDGFLKITIWPNEGENGTFLSFDPAKTYEGRDGKLHDTRSFSHSDMLKLEKLAGRAYARGQELKREFRQAQEEEQTPARRQTTRRTRKTRALSR